MKRGKKTGIGKVTGEFDYTRLVSGDAVADLSRKQQWALRILKWSLLGDILDVIKKSDLGNTRVGGYRPEPFLVSWSESLAWFLEELKLFATGKKPQEEMFKLLRGLAAIDEIPGPERNLAMVLNGAMLMGGNKAQRHIYCTQATLRKWINRRFPGTFSAHDNGASTLHQALARWGIKCFVPPGHIVWKGFI